MQENYLFIVEVVGFPGNFTELKSDHIKWSKYPFKVSMS